MPGGSRHPSHPHPPPPSPWDQQASVQQLWGQATLLGLLGPNGKEAMRTYAGLGGVLSGNNGVTDQRDLRSSLWGLRGAAVASDGHGPGTMI